MARPSIFTQKLHSGRVYHVYNRTNNQELLFRNRADRFRFLRNIERFIKPFVDIFAFNLLPNHFHLLLEVLTKEQFLNRASTSFIEDLPLGCKSLIKANSDNMDLILENRFKALFSGYATYFNMKHQRKGNFLHRPFCRKWIHSSDYFKRAVFYIHANSLKHEIHKNWLDHEWTSYHQAIANDNSFIALEKLFEYFDGRENFFEYHQKDITFEKDEHFLDAVTPAG